MCRITSLVCSDQEFGDGLEIIEVEVYAARVVEPAQRLAVAIDHPEIDMKRDVRGGRRVAAGELRQCCVAYFARRG